MKSTDILCAPVDKQLSHITVSDAVFHTGAVSPPFICFCIASNMAKEGDS